MQKGFFSCQKVKAITEKICVQKSGICDCNAKTHVNHGEKMQIVGPAQNLLSRAMWVYYCCDRASTEHWLCQYGTLAVPVLVETAPNNFIYWAQVSVFDQVLGAEGDEKDVVIICRKRAIFLSPRRTRSWFKMKILVLFGLVYQGLASKENSSNRDNSLVIKLQRERLDTENERDIITFYIIIKNINIVQQINLH